MSTKLQLKTLQRHRAERNSAIRSSNLIPAIVYGGSNQMVSIDGKEFTRNYLAGHLSSAVVELDMPDRKIAVIVRDVQFHPVTDKVIHVDFQEVFNDKLLKILVPVHVHNTDRCNGIKRGGVLNMVLHRIAFRCLPENIPNAINVDIKDLEIGSVVHINDLQLGNRLFPVDKGNFAILSIAGRVEEKEQTAADNAATTTSTAA